jgi:predicted nucleic-acid-binding Zn-ribbon protein
MFIIYGATREEEQGPTVEITCPKCGQSYDADSVEVTEWVKLFIVIPILRLRNTYLTCTRCRKSYLVKMRLDELAYADRQDLDAMLAVSKPSFMTSFFVILTAVLCILPFIGLLLSLISLALTWKKGGWRKIIAWIALAVSLAATIFALSNWS